MTKSLSNLNFYGIIRFMLKLSLLHRLQKYSKTIRILMDTAFDPATERLPLVKKNWESSIAGVHLIGDISGTPLLKNGINMGYELIENLKGTLKKNHDPNILDVLIVGSGGAGLSAALHAKECGLSHIIIEQEGFAQTIQNFPKGKPIYAEPLSIPKKGSLFLSDKTSKEELLERWKSQIKEHQIDIHYSETVLDLKSKGKIIEIKTDKASYNAKRVILAIGRSGKARKLHCKGEELPKVRSTLQDPDDFRQKKIIIYGGGDVACETAIALCQTNDVTMVYRGSSLQRPIQRNKSQIENLAKNKKIALILDTELKEIKDKSVIIKDSATGSLTEIENDDVFTMIGSDLPMNFFRRVGIKLERQWHFKRWFFLILSFMLVYTVYAIDKGKWLPVFDGATVNEWLVSATGFKGYHWYAALYTIVMVVFGSFAAVRWSKSKALWKGSPFQKQMRILFGIFIFLLPTVGLFIVTRGYLGTDSIAKALGSWIIVFYIVLILLAALTNIFLWTGLKYDRIKMQGFRYGALLFTQLLLFGLGSIYSEGTTGTSTDRIMAGHAYKLVYNGPLSINAFVDPSIELQKLKQQESLIHNQNDISPHVSSAKIAEIGHHASISQWVFIFGLAFTFILIPLITIFGGKGFCTWVCGCGGLAETLGDRWRHHAPKGKKSVALEIQSTIIMIIFFLLVGWIFFRLVTESVNPKYDGITGVFYNAYAVVVDWWLIAVIPVALYPFFGGKIWCRYWCPLAKYMQFWSKLWRKLGIGRYQISSKKGCISCNECSKYCQVGINVMQFAKNEEAFDNTNSSCIACGICVSVCPMDVLTFKDLSKSVQTEPSISTAS